MADPRGYLVTPVAFDENGYPRGLRVDADGYLRVAIDALAGADPLADPRGKLVTVVGFDDDGYPRAFQVDAADDLLVAILGGTAGYVIASDGTKGVWTDPATLIVGSQTACARVYRTTNQTIPNDTETAISFNAERFDTDGFHSLVTNPDRLTIPAAGVYLVGGQLRYEPDAVGVRAAIIYLNGTSRIGFNRFPNAGAAIASQLEVVTLWSFAANDYVQLRADQNSGGDLDVQSQASWSPEFWIHRLS